MSKEALPPKVRKVSLVLDSFWRRGPEQWTWELRSEDFTVKCNRTHLLRVLAWEEARKVAAELGILEIL